MFVLSKIKSRFVAAFAAAAVATSALCALPAAAAGTYTYYVSSIYSSGYGFAYLSNYADMYESYIGQYNSDSGSGTSRDAFGFTTNSLFRTNTTTTATYISGSSTDYLYLDNSSLAGYPPNYVYAGQGFYLNSDADTITSITFNFSGYWYFIMSASYSTSSGGGTTSSYSRFSYSSAYTDYFNFYVLVYDGFGNLVASDTITPVSSNTQAYSLTLDGFAISSAEVVFLCSFDLYSSGIYDDFMDYGDVETINLRAYTSGTISNYYWTVLEEEVSSTDYSSSLSNISGLLSGISSILGSIRSYVYNIYSQLLDLPTLIYNKFSSDLDTIIESLSGSGGVSIDFPDDYATSTYQETISTTASNIYSRLSTTNSTLSTISTAASSIVSGVSDVVDSVTSLPASIWSAFSDGLIGLFVPDADDITDLVDGYEDVILGKLGFVGSVFSYIVSLFTAFTSYSSVTSLTFPGIDLTSVGIPFTIEAQAVDLFPSGYDGLQTSCKIITTAMFIFAWCNGVLRFYHSIFADSVSVE